MLSNILVRSLAVLIALSSHYVYAASCTFNTSNEWGEGFSSSVTITNDTAVSYTHLTLPTNREV